jgi:hypothetical protein
MLFQKGYLGMVLGGTRSDSLTEQVRRQPVPITLSIFPISLLQFQSLVTCPCCYGLVETQYLVVEAAYLVAFKSRERDR